MLWKGFAGPMSGVFSRKGTFGGGRGEDFVTISPIKKRGDRINKEFAEKAMVRSKSKSKRNTGALAAERKSKSVTLKSPGHISDSSAHSRYFHVNLQRRPEGLGLQLVAVNHDGMDAIIIIEQNMGQVYSWKLSNQEKSERKKIMPGLEIVAINGELLEPRTMKRVQHVVRTSDEEDIVLTLRKVSRTEGKVIERLIKKVQPGKEVFLSPVPPKVQHNRFVSPNSKQRQTFHSKLNGAESTDGALQKTDNSEKVYFPSTLETSRETFPYTSVSSKSVHNAKINKSGAFDPAAASKNSFKVQLDTLLHEDSEGSGPIAPDNTDIEDDGGFDEAEIKYDEDWLDTQIEQDMLENKSDAESSSSQISVDDGLGSRSSSAESAPDPAKIRKELIVILSTLKYHQAAARDALVSITTKEKSLRKTLGMEQDVYERLVLAEEDHIIEAAQDSVKLPGLSETEKQEVWVACQAMMMEARGYATVKRDLLNTLESIKEQIASMRDALDTMVIEEQLGSLAKGQMHSSPCVSNVPQMDTNAMSEELRTKLLQGSKVLRHTFKCINASKRRKGNPCVKPQCKEMKTRLHHMKKCKILLHGGKCNTCQNMLFLFKFLKAQKSGGAGLLAAVEEKREDGLGKSLSVILEEDIEGAVDTGSISSRESMGQINARILELDAQMTRIKTQHEQEQREAQEEFELLEELEAEEEEKNTTPSSSDKKRSSSKKKKKKKRPIEKQNSK